ncbi:hypothetical protein ACF1BP_30190 [Streptomyces sp. NPDC014735]|uniref:hypothetical protein n=1 Tax=unclassified Streptomyces TaxID=2593676 RepID=UPI003702D4B1
MRRARARGFGLGGRELAVSGVELQKAAPAVAAENWVTAVSISSSVISFGG